MDDIPTSQQQHSENHAFQPDTHTITAFVMVASCLRLLAYMDGQVRLSSAILDHAVSLPHLLPPGHDSVVLLYFRSGSQSMAALFLLFP